MKRTLVGIGLLVAAGVGSVAMAPGGAAQSQEDRYEFLEAELVPDTVEPGGSVTFSSIDPCTFKEAGDTEDLTAEPGTVVISKLDEEGNIVEELDSVDMDEEGHWTYEFNAESEPGEYIYGAECRNSIYDEELRKCPIDEEQAADAFQAENVSYRGPSRPMWQVDCLFQVYYDFLTVTGDEVPSPTTTVPGTPPVDTPPPATPVVTPPDFSG